MFLLIAFSEDICQIVFLFFDNLSSENIPSTLKDCILPFLAFPFLSSMSFCPVDGVLQFLVKRING